MPWMIEKEHGDPAPFVHSVTTWCVPFCLPDPAGPCGPVP